jgi:4-alpha-glucanotransferase
MDLFVKARDLGIQTEFIDGQGRPHVTAADALKVVFEALPPQAARALLDGPVVVRQGHAAHSMLLREARFPVRWEISDETRVVAGETLSGAIAWPENLPLGVYRLRLTDAGGITEEAPLVSAPARAFGGDFDRGWLLAVQLYGVRSTRNWGMGDFTDLADLIDLAHQLGADGIGLNPLHALFDDKPGDCSPYSPNSRLFLNALYIDAGALPEFSAQAVPDVAELTPRLRQSDDVDYVAVAGLKWQALRAAFAAFKVNPHAERKADFEKFRSEQGALLAHFACFEMLRPQVQKAVVGMAGGVADAG